MSSSPLLPDDASRICAAENCKLQPQYVHRKDTLYAAHDPLHRGCRPAAARCYTHEGIVGRSYLEPYLKQSVKYIVPAIRDLAEAARDKPIAPFDTFRAGRASLGLVGLEGMSLIAVAGLDMAVWDALAKAADLPLVRLLGGSPAPVQAYNSNGLWLIAIDKLGREAADLVAEGGFKGLKLRLGRDRLADDIEAIRVVREAVGSDVKLMVDFNQGLSLGDALHRCHALDDQGLYWLEEPIAYDNIAGYSQLTRELKTPIQLGENFYGPRALFQAVQAGAGKYMMPDLMRIGGVTGWLRAAAIAGAAGIEMSTHLYPEVSAHLMRVTETAHWLEWQDWADPILDDVQARRRPSHHSRSTRQRNRVE
jgi:mandelate racemase